MYMDYPTDPIWVFHLFPPKKREILCSTDWFNRGVVGSNGFFQTAEAKEMPKLEELAHATEETLVDVLGFPEQDGTGTAGSAGRMGALGEVSVCGCNKGAPSGW